MKQLGGGGGGGKVSGNTHTINTYGLIATVKSTIFGHLDTRCVGNSRVGKFHGTSVLHNDMI